jgi:hypothetical protein
VFQLFKSRPGTILCAICFAGGTVWLLLAKPVPPVVLENSGAMPAGNSSTHFVEHTKPASDFPIAENTDFGDPRATDFAEDLQVLGRNAVSHSPKQALATNHSACFYWVLHFSRVTSGVTRFSNCVHERNLLEMRCNNPVQCSPLRRQYAARAFVSHQQKQNKN